MASRFYQTVKDLRNGLNTEDSRNEASEHLRALVDKIVLTPKGGEKELSIDLYGDLAGILNMATENKDMGKLMKSIGFSYYQLMITFLTLSKIVLVAGAGFEPTT
ncbi:MAG: hypothetical protein KAT04_06515, partial [Methylococcales bacterium]|nr:hypothetical protein [Methylococcales bacterium]